MRPEQSCGSWRVAVGSPSCGSSRFGRSVRIVSMTVIKLVGVFGLLVSVALCQVAATLVVEGMGGTSTTFSTADLPRLPQQTVTAFYQVKRDCIWSASILSEN